MAVADILQGFLSEMVEIDPACRANARGMLRKSGRFETKTPAGSIYICDGKVWIIAAGDAVYRCDAAAQGELFLRTVRHLQRAA